VRRPTGPRLTEAAAEAAIVLIVLGLMTAAGFVGWVIGNYAGEDTKTVTVAASGQSTTAQTTTAATTTAATTTAATTTEATTTTPTTTTGAGGGAGNAAAGKAVFTSAGCASCHTLKAAGSNGTVGPNLDERQPSMDKVIERVTEGKGVMPSFKGQLTESQIRNVAAFVSSATRGSD
jgi:mono/diheme cytochrome c family protein